MMKVSTAKELKNELLHFIHDRAHYYNSILTKLKQKRNTNDFRICYEVRTKIDELNNIKNFIIDNFEIDDYCRNDVKNLITILNTFIEQTEISGETDYEQ